uniref:Uncharacterized protein n=1 Tax=Melanopsichium pennsylvanicum 4 TaxID=1398559 RepID=A0A077QZD5_9BASI|nr:uncharacterized protein BN887_00511 [Melanopsichium pennsylvanicum 4]
MGFPQAQQQNFNAGNQPGAIPSMGAQLQNAAQMLQRIWIASTIVATARPS